MVAIGQFWMGWRVHSEVWNELCRLQQWLGKISKALSTMVQEFSEETLIRLSDIYMHVSLCNGI